MYARTRIGALGSPNPLAGSLLSRKGSWARAQEPCGFFLSSQGLGALARVEAPRGLGNKHIRGGFRPLVCCFYITSGLMAYIL